MKIIKVNVGKGYNIFIEMGILGIAYSAFGIHIIYLRAIIDFVVPDNYRDHERMALNIYCTLSAQFCIDIIIIL